MECNALGIQPRVIFMDTPKYCTSITKIGSKKGRYKPNGEENVGVQPLFSTLVQGLMAEGYRVLLLS